MLRNLLSVFVAFVVVMGAAACSPAPAPKSASDDTTVSGVNPAPAPEAPAQQEPPVLTGPVAMVWEPIDTSGFDSQPYMSSWELKEHYIVIVITLRGDADWRNFATQAGIDASEVKSTQLQLGSEAAQSLVDLNEMFDEINSQREDRGDPLVDFDTEPVYFGLDVLS